MEEETTIKGLVVDCLRRQASMEDVLATKFGDPNVVPEAKSARQPTENILNEIIEDLTDLKYAQQITIDFIQTQVISKL